MDKNLNSMLSVIYEIRELEANVYREHLGSLSLVRFRAKINEILETGRKLADDDSLLSLKTFAKFYKLLESIKEFSDNVSKYTTETYTKQHANLNIELENYYDEYLDLKPLLLLAFGNEKEESKRISNLESLINESLNTKEFLEKEVNRIESKIETLDERYNEVVPKVEILHQRDIFKKEASNNQTTAYIWLGMIALVSIILFFLFENILKEFCFEASCFNETKLSSFNKICIDCGQQVLWLEIIKALLFRFLIISLGIYALTFAVKNFNTAMHNRTVNKHKQNSFEAALILIEQTSAEGKDSIVSLAAQAIFTQQKTGYLGKENDALNASVIEQILNRGK